MQHNKQSVGKQVYSEAINHLQLSSVIGSNNITVPLPFLAFHVNGGANRLFTAFSFVMNTIHF